LSQLQIKFLTHISRSFNKQTRQTKIEMLELANLEWLIQ